VRLHLKILFNECTIHGNVRKECTNAIIVPIYSTKHVGTNSGVASIQFCGAQIF